MVIFYIIALCCAQQVCAAFPQIFERFDLAHVQEGDIQRTSFKALCALTENLLDAREASEFMDAACVKYLPFCVKQDFLQKRQDFWDKHLPAFSPKSQGILLFCMNSLLLGRLAVLYEKFLLPNERKAQTLWHYLQARLPELEHNDNWNDVLPKIADYLDVEHARASWVFDQRKTHTEIPLRLHGIHVCWSIMPPGFSGGPFTDVITLWLYGLSLCPLLKSPENPDMKNFTQKDFVETEKMGGFKLPILFKDQSTDTHMQCVFKGIAFSEFRTVWDRALEDGDHHQTLITGFIFSAIIATLQQSAASLQNLQSAVPSQKFLINKANLSVLPEYIDVLPALKSIEQKSVADVAQEHCAKHADDTMRHEHLCAQKNYDVIVNNYIAQSKAWQRCFRSIDCQIMSIPSLLEVVQKFQAVFINIQGVILDAVTECILSGVHAFFQSCKERYIDTIVLSKSMQSSQDVQHMLSEKWRKEWRSVVHAIVTMGDLLLSWQEAVGLHQSTQIFCIGSISKEEKKLIKRNFTEVQNIQEADVVIVGKTTKPFSDKIKGYFDYMLCNDIPALPVKPHMRVVCCGRPKTLLEPFNATFRANGGRVFSLTHSEDMLLQRGLEMVPFPPKGILVITDEVVRVEAAQRLGLTTVLVESGSYQRGDVLHYPPDYFSEGIFAGAAAYAAC